MKLEALVSEKKFCWSWEHYVLSSSLLKQLTIYPAVLKLWFLTIAELENLQCWPLTGCRQGTRLPADQSLLNPGCWTPLIMMNPKTLNKTLFCKLSVQHYVGWWCAGTSWCCLARRENSHLWCFNGWINCSGKLLMALSLAARSIVLEPFFSAKLLLNHHSTRKILLCLVFVSLHDLK